MYLYEAQIFYFYKTTFHDVYLYEAQIFIS